MCVAAVIETGNVSSRDLALMDLDNPHGAGVAFAEGDRVRFIKGLHWRDILQLQDTLPRPYLLHFRWATHGPRERYLTHPFPLGARALTSRALKGYADAVLIHNGVWRDYERKAHPWMRPFLPSTSDTAVAAALAIDDESILDDVAWATAVARAAGGGRLDITLRGRWYERGGNLYSNLSWDKQPSKPRIPLNQPLAPHVTFRRPTTEAEYEDLWGDRDLTSLNPDTPTMLAEHGRIGRSIGDWIDEYERSVLAREAEAESQVSLPLLGGWSEVSE